MESWGIALFLILWEVSFPTGRGVLALPPHFAGYLLLGCSAGWRRCFRDARAARVLPLVFAGLDLAQWLLCLGELSAGARIALALLNFVLRLAAAGLVCTALRRAETLCEGADIGAAALRRSFTALLVLSLAGLVAQLIAPEGVMALLLWIAALICAVVYLVRLARARARFAEHCPAQELAEFR